MPRRLRVGAASGTTVLGLVTATVLAVALLVTGRLLSVPRTGMPVPAQPTPATAATPYRIGDRVVCPLGRPVLATANGRSYPPGHPAQPPPDARPVTCYDTAEQAAAAGYPPAPLPTGALDLGGEYLIPPSGQLRRQCQQAANRLGLVVPCPTLLPAVAPNTVPPAPCDQPSTFPCTPGSEFLFEEGGFTVPSSRIVAYENFGARLAIAAARRLTSFAVSCAGERPVAFAKVRGSRGRLYGCPPESRPHGGGMLLRWEERNAILVVSVSGQTDLHRRLVLALADHLELVQPGK